MFLLFVLGLCVGSFLNVVIDRLCSTSQEPKSLLRHLRGVLGGRSYCDHCRRQLAWYDNIPLLSFILLRGRCRWCHSPISWQYPGVELATGIITVLVFLLSNYELRVTSYELIIAYCLIVVFVSDWKYQIIPDQIIYPAIIFTLLYLLGSYELRVTSYLISGGLAAAFFFFLYLVTKKRGMGLGDVKLAFLMGLILGFPKIVVALYFAFLTGAAVGVILILLGKKRFGQHIPFGPFLVGGTILSYLSHLGYLW
jgi:prepilin signal peptidase PulO-like enzyme (type II secretory pathway)